MNKTELMDTNGMCHFHGLLNAVEFHETSLFSDISRRMGISFLSAARTIFEYDYEIHGDHEYIRIRGVYNGTVFTQYARVPDE